MVYNVIMSLSCLIITLLSIADPLPTTLQLYVPAFGVTGADLFSVRIPPLPQLSISIIYSATHYTDINQGMEEVHN